MASVPSDTLAGAAVSAAALADRVAGLARTLPLPEAVAADTLALCRRLAAVDAVRLRAGPDVGALAAALVTALQTAARAAEPADAAPALYALAAATRTAYPLSASPVLGRRYALARALCAALELAALGEAFVAEARAEYPDRDAATRARARIGSALDAAHARLSARLGAVALASLETAAREAGRQLVDRTTSLQPVVRVEAGRSAPSTALAYALYGDPARAPDLVARNAVATPLFMPAAFEAVSPAAPGI